MKKNKHSHSKSPYLSNMLRLKTRIDKNDIQISDAVIHSWQGMMNTISEIVDVPVALIRKVDGPDIEVVSSSQSSHNPYEIGKKGDLVGCYCEKVIETRNQLLVPNARSNGEWDKNPDVKLGMISYLGLPCSWPDGEIFGTICVLDSKEHSYDSNNVKLMLRFKELVEAHLALVYKNMVDRRSLEDILDNLTEGIIAHDTERRILFFNRAAEQITGYPREDVIGKDCHTVFGGPFCGGRCSFRNDAPQSLDHVAYPLNILTRDGEPRRLEMTVIGMGDDMGHLVGAIASFRDVTDLIGLKIAYGDLKGFAGIIGRNPAMLQVYRQIRDLATNDYPVHISGETGTGKELVAVGIHNESRRGGRPFVPVNCAALPESMLESELFGHVKGAFTGAVRDKKGRFDLADNGTLFLDEVADLSRGVQAKLLRVLQDGTFERVGGEKTVSMNVRLISATNRDLKREVGRGHFREDLYYRINVVPIHLPPLRERQNDIPLLVAHFLAQAAEDGQTTIGFSNEAMSVMTGYPWPGNVRELQSAIRFALVRSKGRLIQLGDLPIELKDWHNLRSTRGLSRKLDTESVRAALAQTGGNKAKAARILGVGRATLYRFLADFPNVS
jgi:PAS domain S-box-containing protein